MTNTQKFAKRELDILAATVPDAIVTPFAKEILALCEAFGNSGQSVVLHLTRLLQFHKQLKNCYCMNLSVM